MLLSPDLKLGELIEKYPFLIEFLPAYNPMFAPIKSPEMRATIGQTANLDMVSKMGQVPIAKLVEDLKAAIKMQTGEDVLVAQLAAPMTKEERAEVLKGIIRDLHAGVDFTTLKRRFAELVKDISPNEISDMEQELLKEGMPKDEIKRLCDVHVEIFKEALAKQEPVITPPGHPIHTFMDENKALGDMAKKLKELIEQLGTPPDTKKYKSLSEEISNTVETLALVDKHYIRKENQLFPFLERHGVTAPSQVMWAIHDDIRMMIKQLRKAIADKNIAQIVEQGLKFVQVFLDMIYKEEHILFPMCFQTLKDDEWVEIRSGELEIGYVLVTPGNEWKPHLTGAPAAIEEALHSEARVMLGTGTMTVEELKLVMNTLPLEFTFVDDKDEVRYYSAGKERIFPRSPGVIGRKVQNCHPPKSMHVVNRILGEFRSGKRDSADFWINYRGRFLLIRYYAIRDDAGKYRGCLEVTQDITMHRELEGERRLLSGEEAEK